MARIRTIKPEFWTDEDIASLSEPTRLLAIGLLNHSDDEGYFKAHPMLIKAAVFPLNEPSVSIHGMINELSSVNYIMLCKGSDGKQYGKIRNFTTHQRVNRPNASKIKGLCSFTADSVIDQLPITAGTGNREQGTGKGTGKESPAKRKRFTPPSIEDVSAYMIEKSGNANLAQKFMNHYESNGWKVGRNKMIDWKAAVRNWLSNDFSKSPGAAKQGNQDPCAGKKFETRLHPELQGAPQHEQNN